MPKRTYHPKRRRTTTVGRHVRSLRSGGTYLWPKINRTKEPNNIFRLPQDPKKS